MKDRLMRKNEFDGNLNFGARNFNEKTGRDVHLKNREVSPEYFSEDSNSIHESFLQHRSCPLCGQDDYSTLFNKSGFFHVRCRKCSLVYVNPILKEEKLHNFYLDEQSYNNVLTNSLQMELDRKRFNYHLDVIEHYMESCEPKTLLDVGAGPGTFVEVAKERSWEPTAIEFNSFCVQRIRSLGIPCIDMPLENVDLPDNSFDCITLWAVFEHLQEPQKLLSVLHRLLVPGGILAILVPNIDSLAARIMHQDCATFSGDAHINFFNAETLTSIQESNGFEVQDVETVFSEVNTIRNYLGFYDPYGGNSDEDFDFLDPRIIHENLFGYALVTYSRKLYL